MPIITSSKTQPSYDLIVVGSGAAGGQTAYTAVMEGAKVLMLEAGRSYDPVTETPMFQNNSQAPLRAAATPDKQFFGYYDATVDGGWEVPGEPYTSASSDPARKFWWWRPRMLGGRTNHWGRISLRNGPYDFKPRSRDGLGFELVWFICWLCGVRASFIQKDFVQTRPSSLKKSFPIFIICILRVELIDTYATAGIKETTAFDMASPPE